MQGKTKSFRTARSRRKEERGVALITTLLLLLLLSGLSLAMVMSVRSDLLTNGYYRNFRGSFYAADSGLNIVRRAMVNALEAAAPTGNFNPNTQPIPSGTETNVVSSINSTYGSGFAIAPSASWPESFKIDTTQTSLSLVTCTTSNGSLCTAPTGNPSTYTYQYHYNIVATGQAQGGEQATITDQGNFTLLANVTASQTVQTVNTSFAAWGMFIDQYSICSGGTLVPGTISGPVFTNGAWNFGTSGKYIFTDSVGSVSNAAGYQFSGGCDQIAGNSDTKSGTTIAPTFNQGFNRGQNPVPLPSNSFNQERAVLDGQGTSSTAVSNSDLNAVVKDAKQNAYPSGGASSGVFLPYNTKDSSGHTLVPPQFSGGGIYVKGDAGVKVSPGPVAGSEVYTITQGSGPTTTTVTVNPTPITISGVNYPNGTTTMTTGANTVIVNGVPASRDSSGSAQSSQTMLYVDGNITSLSGPGSGQAGIQDGVALTITAAGNVTVTGDVLYKTEPVTTAQGTTPPADTLISGNDKGQVLGIFTATGNVNLQNGQSSGNLEIDASVATISQGGSGAIVNTGNSINTLTIVGGRIQNTIQNIGATTRNVFFDRRFSSNGFAPPWFPSTTITPTTTVTQDQSVWTNPTFQRVQWLYKNSTY